MRKASKCIECDKRRKLFRWVTPIGTLPLCRDCTGKVLTFSTKKTKKETKNVDD